VVNVCFKHLFDRHNKSHAVVHPRHISRHGTDEQKQTYLPKLTSGEWTGTMCLTEPHCGTDLGLLRTKAEPQADGTYKITGNKIFISAGEHDMAANIVHLVLARLPDAPGAARASRLFVVPKFLVNADGSWASATPSSAGLEHKMGIHGNATCADEPRRRHRHPGGRAQQGPAAMFVMMNAARLGVGNQSLGLTEWPTRTRWPTPRTASRCAPVRPQGQGQGRPTRSSCTPTCARCC
jgi:alkylation response protein AidB-like acyl-CoA dehydrogenase